MCELYNVHITYVKIIYAGDRWYMIFLLGRKFHEQCESGFF